MCLLLVYSGRLGVSATALLGGVGVAIITPKGAAFY